MSGLALIRIAAQLNQARDERDLLAWAVTKLLDSELGEKVRTVLREDRDRGITAEQLANDKNPLLEINGVKGRVR